LADLEKEEEESRLTLWRRMGERSGSRAGGGFGEKKAVGRQARSGGRSSLAFGGVMSCIVVVWC